MLSLYQYESARKLLLDRRREEGTRDQNKIKFTKYFISQAIE